MKILNIVLISLISFALISLYNAIKNLFASKKYNCKIKGIIADIVATEKNIEFVIKWHNPLINSKEHSENQNEIITYYYNHKVQALPVFKNEDEKILFLNKLVLKYLDKPFYLQCYESNNIIEKVAPYTNSKFDVCWYSLLLLVSSFVLYMK
jgi:hypothetical protein